MSSLFSLDGKLYGFLSKLAKIMWINLLTILCSLPVITLGASLTAMNKVVYQIFLEEDDALTRTFFKAFAENFKQATLIFVFYLAALVLFWADFRLFEGFSETLRAVSLILVCVLGLMILFSFTWVFILQSRYTNTIIGTIKLSFAVWIGYLPRTVAMMLLILLPFVVTVFYLQVLPVTLFLGLAGPAFLEAYFYRGVFRALEEQDKSEESK